MTALTPKQQFFTLIALGTILTGVLIGIMFLVTLPNLHAARTLVDEKRARITVLQEQRSNLLALKAEEDAIVEAQDIVDRETWTFVAEDAFYESINGLFRQAGVRGEEPRLTDATPTNEPIVRTGTIEMTGGRDAILQALRLLRSIRPVIGITNVEFHGMEQVRVLITITTLWQ